MGIEIHSKEYLLSVSSEPEQKNATTSLGKSSIVSAASEPSSLPQVSKRSEEKAENVEKDLQKVTDELNVNQRIRQHNLEFKVNEDLGRTIVKVVDSESGDLIRQIPSEELVALAERIEKQTQELEGSVGYFIDSII